MSLCLASRGMSASTVLAFVMQAFTSQPDVADDCFLLASRCIRYCPHLLVPTTMLPPLVDCAMTGITIQHRYSFIFLAFQVSWP